MSNYESKRSQTIEDLRAFECHRQKDGSLFFQTILANFIVRYTPLNYSPLPLHPTNQRVVLDYLQAYMQNHRRPIPTLSSNKPHRFTQFFLQANWQKVCHHLWPLMSTPPTTYLTPTLHPEVNLHDKGHKPSTTDFFAADHLGQIWVGEIGQTHKTPEITKYLTHFRQQFPLFKDHVRGLTVSYYKVPEKLTYELDLRIHY